MDRDRPLVNNDTVPPAGYRVHERAGYWWAEAIMCPGWEDMPSDEQPANPDAPGRHTRSAAVHDCIAHRDRVVSGSSEVERLHAELHAAKAELATARKALRSVFNHSRSWKHACEIAESALPDQGALRAPSDEPSHENAAFAQLDALLIAYDTALARRVHGGIAASHLVDGLRTLLRGGTDAKTLRTESP